MPINNARVDLAIYLRDLYIQKGSPSYLKLAEEAELGKSTVHKIITGSSGLPKAETLACLVMALDGDVPSALTLLKAAKKDKIKNIVPRTDTSRRLDNIDQRLDSIIEMLKAGR